MNIILNKKKYGQFYTKNYEYILDEMKIPKNIKKIIEPFCGEGDLIKFLDENKYNLECYDIEPKKDYIKKRDTILNPPCYKNKFIITNPPYLARNKSKDKSLYNKYDVNDLYKCFIKNLLENESLGGIIIIPLNFWSSIRKKDIELRRDFIEKYKIKRLNIFEEKVFDDTSYTICSFLFLNKSKLKSKSKNINKIKSYIYKNKIKKKLIFKLNENNNYTIGGEIYKLKLNKKIIITRLTSKNILEKSSNILVKCIDDNLENKICLKIVDDKVKEKYIDKTPNLTNRTYAILVIKPFIDLNLQKKLCLEFNNYLNKNRDKYNSLFLTNYRESKDIARKRISFELVYNIVNYILSLKLN